MLNSKSFLAAMMMTVVAAPVFAQAASPQGGTAPVAIAIPDVTVGATVKDVQGGMVGTIGAIANGVATVDTGTNKIGVAVGSFAAGTGGLVLGMTKAQLDEAAKGAQASAAADLAAALVPGAAVADTGGGAVGKVDTVEGKFVTVATAKSKVRLPRTAFAKGPNGLVIGMTAAQLEAAATTGG